MIIAHTVAQVRAAEEAAANESGWDALMQRAASALAVELDALLPADGTTAMLIGPGNNGGDALFAAAHLCERGRRVNLCLLDEDSVHPAGLSTAIRAGASVIDDPSGHDLVVDALFGIGARAGLSGKAAAWAAWQRDSTPFTVAVDVPSGVGVDDGTTPGPHFRADHTITFGTAKVCLLLGPAAAAAGQVTVVDIGLTEHLGPPTLESLEPGDGALLAPLVGSVPTVHKYSRGVLGVAAGSATYAGAAHLCVAGALAGTAGMLRFHGSAALSDRVVDRAPEVVSAPGRVQAWVVGPGDDSAGEHLRHALADGVPVLIDAGALQHVPARLDVPALLTPHAGELAAMLGVDRTAVEDDPLGHARAASDRWHATVLLKGHRTVVVSPGTEAVRVNTSGTRWLATAGSGDVLAGFAGSLLASGLDPLAAGSFAAFLHGAAAVNANPGGPVTASDVASALPRAMADFLTGRLTKVRDW